MASFQTKWAYNWQVETRYFDKATGQFYVKNDDGSMQPVHNQYAQEQTRAQAQQSGKPRK